MARPPLPNIRIPDLNVDPVGYERAINIFANHFGAQIPPEDADASGIDNPNHRPYCMRCTTMARMVKTAYGFRCYDTDCTNKVQVDWAEREREAASIRGLGILPTITAKPNFVLVD